MVEWRVRIRGKQREPVDTALVIRAIIMLGKQMERERREADRRGARPTEDTMPEQSEASS
jgi:hypothetical protein